MIIEKNYSDSSDSPAQGSVLPAQGFSCSSPALGLIVSAPREQETTPIDKRDTAVSIAIYLTFIIDCQLQKFYLIIPDK